MKIVIPVALALLFGLFLGGLGPRAELARAKKELADAKEAAAREGSGASLPLALGVGGLVAAAERARDQGETARRPPRFVVPSGDGNPATTGEGGEPQAGGGTPDAGGPDAGRRRRF